MKLAVKCDNFDLAKKLIDKKVDKLYFGIKGFSCRFNDYIDLKMLEKIVKIKSTTKISIILNNLYSESEIIELEKLISNISKINIDEICFQDFGVLQICYEKKIHIRMHYNPETLNTNYGQISFLTKNNIKTISLAREISLNEVITILENKSDMEIEIQAHGLTFFMHSKWPMVSNFKKYLEIKKQKLNKLKYLVIQEEKRKMPNIIYEDYTGTHMLSGFTLSIYAILSKFYDAGLDYIFIDTIFRDEEWILKVVDIYLSGIEDLKNKSFDKNKQDELKHLEKEFPISESFLGDFRKMPQMEKEDYEN